MKIIPLGLPRSSPLFEIYSRHSPRPSDDVVLKRIADEENSMMKMDPFDLSFPSSLFEIHSRHAPRPLNNNADESLDADLLLTEHDHGGHFIALEEPDDVVKDLRDCFSKLYK